MRVLISPLPLFMSVISAVVVTYDTSFDDGSRSLGTRACSTGDNGLLTAGYSTQDTLPPFPWIGGSFAVKGWNSTGCGTCWALTYKSRRLNVFVVDSVGEGFNIAKSAMDALTDGRASELGRIDALYEQVDVSGCGMMDS